ncbi:MAG: endonuclease, partial [Neobacillus sp.]|nr:endonuclease [Neobacillus sp.]
PQEQTYELIDAYLDKAQKEIKHYSKLPFETAIKNTTISTLFDVWNDYKLESKVNRSFEEILPKLTESTMPIKATMVNTRTKAKGLERLDYEPYKEKGYRVIAIGGNSLSRGITLEGLCVSYFYRESKMYDTLLQMGRWFGYRPGYKDICKVWMTERTAEWYSFITKACNELRSEITYMNKLMQTPKDFGLKVREHPDTLMITASNKMRTAKPFETWISLSGKLVETPWLTTKTVEYNYKHTVNFIENIANKVSVDNSKSERLYTDVPSNVIAEYVRNFASHPGHLVFNAREIGRYIENNAINLKDWCVLIANGTEPDDREIAGIIIKRSVRGLSIVDDCIRVSGNKSRVGSVGTTKITLSEEAKLKALKCYLEERNEKEKDGKVRKTDKVTVPDHMYLRYAEKPLLIIYLMVCKDEEKYSAASQLLGDKTVVALGLGFPRTNEKEEKAYYKVNMVEYQKNFSNVDLNLEGDEDED